MRCWAISMMLWKPSHIAFNVISSVRGASNHWAMVSNSIPSRCRGHSARFNHGLVSNFSGGVTACCWAWILACFCWISSNTRCLVSSLDEFGAESAVVWICSGGWTSKYSRCFPKIVNRWQLTFFRHGYCRFCRLRNDPPRPNGLTHSWRLSQCSIIYFRSMQINGHWPNVHANPLVWICKPGWAGPIRGGLINANSICSRFKIKLGVVIIRSIMSRRAEPLILCFWPKWYSHWLGNTAYRHWEQMINRYSGLWMNGSIMGIYTLGMDGIGALKTRRNQSRVFAISVNLSMNRPPINYLRSKPIKTWTYASMDAIAPLIRFAWNFSMDYMAYGWCNHCWYLSFFDGVRV